MAVSPNSEWTNHHGALEMFGLRRTFLYWLAKEGSIESVSLTHGDKKRGVRLFNVTSIRRFIESQAKKAAIVLLAALLSAIPARASDQYVYPGGENKPIQRWTYPNYATMTGDTGFFAQDVNEIAFKSDDNSFYFLVDPTPTWKWFAGYPFTYNPLTGLAVCNGTLQVSTANSFNGYQINGLTIVGGLMRGGAGNTSLYVTPIATQGTPGAPASTISTVGVMMGLGGAITTGAASSGKVLIIISGSISNSASINGAKVQIRHGTGTAPVNGAALVGTADGASPQILNNANTAALKVPFTCNAIVTGLTATTAYWIDLSLTSITGGTSQISDVSISAHEL